MQNLSDLVTNCIMILINLGCNIKIADLKTIKFADIGKDIANTNIVNKHSYNLVFNEKLNADKKYKFLICAIYHELCHIIQFNEVFDANLLDFDTENNEFVILTDNQDLITNTIFSNNYHTPLWYDIVKQVNNALRLDPPLKDYLTKIELDKFLEEFFMKIPKRIKGPIIITDTLVSGLTIDDLDNYSFVETKSDLNETNNKEIDHSYRKWLDVNKK